MKKYLKFNSLSWWASFIPLLAGLTVATQPLHGMDAVTLTIDNLTGDVPAAVLINAGLLGIGIRGAL